MHPEGDYNTSTLEPTVAKRESLVDKKVIARTEAPVSSILPDVNVIQIDGHSIMDRGRSALLPLLDEIVANQAKHRMIIGVGSSVRSRHIFSVGLDLGLPTGAQLPLAQKILLKMHIWFLAFWRSMDLSI